MANRTVKDAKSIRGTNPQYLVEKIIRSRVYDSKYWKEECFALTAELLVDKAMELRLVNFPCSIYVSQINYYFYIYSILLPCMDFSRILVGFDTNACVIICLIICIKV